MNKMALLVGLSMIVAMLSGCAEFDNSAYRSDQYGSGGDNYSGHAHH